MWVALNRYIGAVSASVFTIGFVGCLHYARSRMQFIDRKAVDIICGICLISVCPLLSHIPSF